MLSLYLAFLRFANKLEQTCTVALGKQVRFQKGKNLAIVLNVTGFSMTFKYKGMKIMMYHSLINKYVLIVMVEE